jgi:glycosyltransferase involved in cell wall biosynthesis
VKMMFVANVLPLKTANQLGLSMAGLKFVLSVCRNFNELLGTDNFDMVSLSKIPASFEDKINDSIIWDWKKYTRIKGPLLPVISDFVQGINFTRHLLSWRKSCRKRDRVVVLVNSPAHIAIMLAIFKKLLDIRVFSRTIDTPFTGGSSFKGILGLYNKLYFKTGHVALKRFDGIFVFHKKAVECLRLNIPFCEFFTGFDTENELVKTPNLAGIGTYKQTGRRKIAFAGTFIYYNGICELLEAFTTLDSDLYELHMFGYGELQHVIEKYSRMHENVFLHGRVDSEHMQQYYGKMDLLVNPRLSDEHIRYFTFPSKIVEYILSGRPVLTTGFSTMPHEYRDFVHLIEEETPAGIKSAIERVFEHTRDELEERCRRGIKFVAVNQNYNLIVKKMYDFLNNKYGKSSLNED